MNPLLENLDKLLVAAAIGQLVIAALNFCLDRILGWSDEIAGMSPLVREVFFTHK